MIGMGSGAERALSGRKGKYLLGAAAFGFTVLLGAWAGSSPPAPTPEAETDGEGAEANAPEAVAVEVARVVRRDIALQYGASATLEAARQVDIAAPKGGVLVALPRSEGQNVEAGAILAQIDARTARAQLGAAEARVLVAQHRFNRYQTLSRQNNVALQDLEETEARLSEARANQVLSEVTLAELSVQAPFPGQIGRPRMEVGSFVERGTTLMSLRQTDVLKFSAEVPQRLMASIDEGQSFTFDPNALPHMQVSGTIDSVSAWLDDRTRGLQFQGRIDNSNGQLKAGMFGRVTVNFGTAENVLVVPSTAIVQNLSGSAVFRIRDGKAERLPVTTGQSQDGYVEVEGELHEGDRVVTVGQFKLSSGTPVHVRAGAHQ